MTSSQLYMKVLPQILLGTPCGQLKTPCGGQYCQAREADPWTFGGGFISASPLLTVPRDCACQLQGCRIAQLFLPLHHWLGEAKSNSQLPGRTQSRSWASLSTCPTALCVCVLVSLLYSPFSVISLFSCHLP